MEDLSAVRRVKNGDTEAFSILVEKYHRSLLTFIYRLMGDVDSVEDIGQEVFLNVYRSLKDFDETRGIPFSAWLFIAAKNRCISELRTRNGKENVSIAVIAELAAGGRTAEESLLAEEKQRALQSSLEQLPEPYRSTIFRSLLGDSLDEIAVQDGISLGTVKSRLSRAKDKMRLLVKEYFGGKGYERV